MTLRGQLYRYWSIRNIRVISITKGPLCWDPTTLGPHEGGERDVTADHTLTTDPRDQKLDAADSCGSGGWEVRAIIAIVCSSSIYDLLIDI